jgi:glutamine amidotransferase
VKLHLIDYGVGNVWNVHRALRHVGADVIACTEPQLLAGASAMVLPGVGAFGDCVGRLRQRGFEPWVTNFAREGGYIFAICVGMQLLADFSEEFGHHKGLGLVPGTVRRLPQVANDGQPLKVPNIGWRPVSPTRERAWSGTPLDGTSPGEFFYFVHSYNFDCTDPASMLACADYNGHPITAMVRYKNTFGTQFHPEKSGETGLELLRRFIAAAEAQSTVRAAE